MKWSKNNKKDKSEYNAARKIITDSINEKKNKKKLEKEQYKKEYKELKEKIKLKEQEIKNIKLDYRQLKKEIPKKPKDDWKTKNNELKEKTYTEIENKKDEIYTLRFEFGKKHKTLNWSLKKWAYGVGKEFRRIIWSPPILTIKYLGIVILIVGILSAIFTAILYITKLL